MSVSGREYTVPSTFTRSLAQTVDLFVICNVQTFLLLYTGSGMNDCNRFHFKVVMPSDKKFHLDVIAAALNIKMLMIVYEVLCVWGVNGATPGKYLFGLRVVMCDTSTTVRPNRILVVPGSSISLSACIVRVCLKVIISSFFPFFIGAGLELDRMFHDVVAGTIVVQHSEDRQARV
ncbi:protein FAM8A1 [Nothobranchius furzeri]|uniref:Family with sequence similarity 8 member A1 n=1 Tax=Nothobranchius furzeri TaxID=105023 RepID=A0A8C6M4P5_NOTFU|nr:protein FAM8A1 [Nothobranchius furzeri]KAF7211124.1 family with sequence similarity 8 member A1 [Nothobranchius furzeri]